MSSLAQFFQSRNTAGNKKQESGGNQAIISLFSQKKQNPVVEVPKITTQPQTEAKSQKKKQEHKQKPESKVEQRSAPKKDEEEENLQATIFVGNVPLASTQKQLKAHFAKYGKILKVWFRSIPVEESKLPKKAKHILKKYQEGADSMNAYVKFSQQDEARAACKQNGAVINDKNIKVTMCQQFDIDYECTIFIGNLPTKVKDQEVWDAFKHIGTIKNVRIIRSRGTLEGIGIGYVRFENKEEMKKAIAEMNGKKIGDRMMRIKKAVPKERLEKKARKMEEKKFKKSQGVGFIGRKSAEEQAEPTGKGGKPRTHLKIADKPSQQQDNTETTKFNKTKQIKKFDKPNPQEKSRPDFRPKDRQQASNNDRPNYNSDRSNFNSKPAPFNGNSRQSFDRPSRPQYNQGASYSADTLNIRGAKQMKKKILLA